MNFKCYASGSAGNLYTVSNDTTKLMIECGVPYKKIESLLNYDLHSIDGCLVSHMHQDHCKAHREIAKAGIDLYMSEETRAAIGAQGHRIHTVKAKTMFRIKDFTILPFETEHDTDGSVGFVIKDNTDCDKMLYLTDSYYCKYRFNDLNMIAIECNYSEELSNENVQDGTVSKYLSNRIQRSHFSLTHLKEFLLANDLSEVRQIYLLHLSNTNADEELIKKEIMQTTGKMVTVC